MLCVALSMCLFVLCVACLTVFVNCLVKHNVFGCSCYFVVECNGAIDHVLPKSVCVVPVIPMSV